MKDYSFLQTTTIIKKIKLDRAINDLSFVRTGHSGCVQNLCLHDGLEYVTTLTQLEFEPVTSLSRYTQVYAL